MNTSILNLCIAILGLLLTGGSDARRLGETEAESSTPTTTTCPPANFATAADLNLDAYIARKWYVHEQAATTYLPPERNYCVTAQYRRLESPTFWGYTLEVVNRARDGGPRGPEVGGTIYAAPASKDGPSSRLEVAPGFLPRFLAGPYWILAFDAYEGQEYALVIGGAPTVPSDTGSGLCRTPNRWITSSGGLWIFTGEAERNEELVKFVRTRAEAEFGLDASVLNRVSHEGCEDDDADAESANPVETATQRNNSS